MRTVPEETGGGDAGEEGTGVELGGEDRGHEERHRAETEGLGTDAGEDAAAH